MCQDGIVKIEGFTTDEILTIYNYTSSSSLLIVFKLTLKTNCASIIIFLKFVYE